MSSALNAEGYKKAAEANDYERMEIELRKIIGGQFLLFLSGLKKGKLMYSQTY
jgi:hypothetical protein